MLFQNILTMVNGEYFEKIRCWANQVGAKQLAKELDAAVVFAEKIGVKRLATGASSSSGNL